MYADERAAWEGPHVDHPEIPVRIEAASFKNRPVYFQVVFPWDRPWREQVQVSSTGERVATILLFIVFLAILLVACLLGRRNLQLGRSDKRGAFKLAIFVFIVGTIGGLIGASHVPDLSEELDILFLIIAYSLLPAALIWLLYIALEPYVRRRWPRLIISWSRLMAGSFRDPMVGRDLLIGGLLGLLHSSFIILGLMLPRWLGFPSPPGLLANVFPLGSIRTMLAVFLNAQVVMSLFAGFAFLFVLLLLYIILRRQWLAAVALFLMALAVEVSAFASSGPRFFWVASILISLTIVIVVARFGLLATMAAQLFFFSR